MRYRGESIFHCLLDTRNTLRSDIIARKSCQFHWCVAMTPRDSDPHPVFGCIDEKYQSWRGIRSHTDEESENRYKCAISPQSQLLCFGILQINRLSRFDKTWSKRTICAMNAFVFGARKFDLTSTMFPKSFTVFGTRSQVSGMFPLTWPCPQLKGRRK